jgi:hypothetical protein
MPALSRRPVQWVYCQGVSRDLGGGFCFGEGTVLTRFWVSSKSFMLMLLYK